MKWRKGYGYIMSPYTVSVVNEIDNTIDRIKKILNRNEKRTQSDTKMILEYVFVLTNALYYMKKISNGYTRRDELIPNMYPE